MWHLITNKLNIFLDPLTFVGKQHISEYVSLGLLEQYGRNLDSCLYSIKYYFPQYIFEKLNRGRRIHFTMRDTEYIEGPPDKIETQFATVFSEIDTIKDSTEKGYLFNHGNELLSLASQNKCYFYLTDVKYLLDNVETIKRLNICPVSFNDLFNNLEIFIQGFYNYFKFDMPAYGINEPDLAHLMSDKDFNYYFDPFYKQLLKQGKYSDETKNTLRTLIYNRYPDILITRDQLKFFQLQRDLLGRDKNNNRMEFHGRLRYYLNYYYYLLWGAVDHFAWLINDLYELGNLRNRPATWSNVGFNLDKKEHKDFVKNIKENDNKLGEHIESQDFQDWFYILTKLRHKSAHKDLFVAPSLLKETEQSKLSDAEIDKILALQDSERESELNRLFSPETVEIFKKSDRQNYRISQMEMTLLVFDVIKKDGKDRIISPLDRIDFDLTQIRKLIKLLCQSKKLQWSQ